VSSRRCLLRVDTAGAPNSQIHRGPGDVEQGCEFGGGVLTGSVELDEVLLLSGFELGLLAAQSAFGFRDRHAFPGARPGEVSLGDHGRHIIPAPAAGRVR